MWPEEEVIYVDLQYPIDTVPNGVPIVSYFLTLKDQEKPEETVLKVIEEDFLQRQGTELKHYLGILIDSSSDSDEYYAFYKHGDTITPCSVELLEPEHQPIELPAFCITSKILGGKKVLIVGCGTFGSSLALELCRAGVDNFILIDPGRISRSELHRTTGSLAEIGRRKTHVLREAIWQKNRAAMVHVFNIEIEEGSTILEATFKQADLIVGLTNQRSNFFVLNEYAFKLGKPLILAKSNNLASFGYLFRTDPAVLNAPCYHCLGAGAFSFHHDRMHFERSGHSVLGGGAPASVPEQSLNIDLLPYTYMLARFCLDFLSVGRLPALYRTTLEESPILLYSTGFYLDGEDPIRVSNQQDYQKLHWYPVAIPCDPQCPVCSTRS